LVSVIERVLLQFEKRLPSTDIKELLVTPELVREPQEELERLIANPGDPEIPKRFQKAARAERDILKKFIWRQEEDLRGRYRLPLSDQRVELLVDHYHQWDCDLKTCFQEMVRLHDQVRVFEERFFDEHAIQLHFDEEAVDEILRRALEGGISALAVCDRLSDELSHALKLVRDRTSRDHFILPREALADLDSYLNRLIRDHYQTTRFRE
jgi:hypothetical protein